MQAQEPNQEAFREFRYASFLKPLFFRDTYSSKLFTDKIRCFGFTSK